MYKFENIENEKDQVTYPKGYIIKTPLKLRIPWTKFQKNRGRQILRKVRKSLSSPLNSLRKIRPDYNRLSTSCQQFLFLFFTAIDFSRG